MDVHQVATMTSRFAEGGWLVEVVVKARGDAHRFVVGRDKRADAEKAIRAYPGVERDDRVQAVRHLTGAELTALSLKTDEIRRYNF
jgi:hypothetical protein